MGKIKRGYIFKERRMVLAFKKAIDELADYDLDDIMEALAVQRDGTTPLYEAVEVAGERIEDYEQ